MSNAARRLKILRNFLAKIQPHTFEMESFKERAMCGTHYCVGGHMARIPFFKRLGYTLKDTRDIDGTIMFYDPANSKKSLDGVSAIEDALGISRNDVHALCYRWDASNHHGQKALDAKLEQIDGLIAKYEGKKS